MFLHATTTTLRGDITAVDGTGSKLRSFVNESVRERTYTQLASRTRQ